MRRIAEIFRRAGVEVAGRIHPGPRFGRKPGSSCHQRRMRCGVCLRRRRYGLRGSAGVAESTAMMGVIPLGTGNVLAHDLGLAARPERAAAQILGFTPAENFSRDESRRAVVAILHRGGRGGSPRGTALSRQRQGEAAGRISGLLHHGARLLFRHAFVPSRWRSQQAKARSSRRPRWNWSPCGYARLAARCGTGVRVARCSRPICGWSCCVIQAGRICCAIACRL